MARSMPEARAKAKRRAKAVVPARKQGSRWWIYALAAAAALYLAFQIYAPALNGPFVFDDTELPYHVPNFSNDLGAWISGVRPLLMFTYWINYQLSSETFYYHVFNVIFHVLNSFLLFFIVRKLLSGSAPRLPERGLDANLLAGFAAAVFLLHPFSGGAQDDAGFMAMNALHLIRNTGTVLARSRPPGGTPSKAR